MYDKIEAPEVCYLEVAESKLPLAGMGLHTFIDINKDEVIALFKGEILTDFQAKERVIKAKDQYFINLPDGRILDSKRRACFAKYANDANGSSKSNFKNNAKIGMDEKRNVCLIATRKIRKGEEIFCSYGKRYWKKHGKNELT